MSSKLSKIILALSKIKLFQIVAPNYNILRIQNNHVYSCIMLYD